MEKKYSQAIPAGYESDASEEELLQSDLNNRNKKIEIVKLVKKHSKSCKGFCFLLFTQHFFVRRR
jgi:hypothetical protein